MDDPRVERTKLHKLVGQFPASRFCNICADLRTGKIWLLFPERVADAEAEIDALVYQLYGLTDEEIAIVEKASNR